MAVTIDTWYTVNKSSLFDAEDATCMQDANHLKALAYLQDHLAEMIALLTKLVVMESSSYDKPSLDRLGGFLGEQLRDLNAALDILPQTKTGDHLRARWGDSHGGALLLCHMDTVLPPTRLHRPRRIARRRRQLVGRD